MPYENYWELLDKIYLINELFLCFLHKRTLWNASNVAIDAFDAYLKRNNGL